MFSLAVVGAGQFAGQFARLWRLHPGVGDIFATDLLPERAERLVADHGLAGALPSFDVVLDSEVDAVAIFTQRWLHGPLVVRALRAGKHVYSAVPMAVTEQEIADIIDAVRDTGLTYMMGETSHYNPATVHARNQVAAGAFGRLFYAEGDYIHDMDLGFYEAYQYSGGEQWKSTASYPPLMYPTHSIGGILGAWQTYATSVSAIGVVDQRGDGVFDQKVSMFENDFSNATGLFEVAGGGSFRTNEFRRVGYPSLTSGNPVFGSSAPRAAWSSWRQSASGRTRTASRTSPISFCPVPYEMSTTPPSPTSRPLCATPSRRAPHPYTTGRGCPRNSPPRATATKAAIISSPTIS
ncbi:Gfo/Idh/MocA family protein [Fodinicola feengrottensis]|uniref:Gfo/Idh/MocA family protein n=1 Tax=Fodinicola feengrottensis TaxID=435914 RepID=UPI002440FDA9|nr:Gfo/Idh/MocA family oxidoreductase [Fodinicola feengrottensis]